MCIGQQCEVEQALRVVIRRAQHLTAGQVFEGGGNATVELHACGVQCAGVAQARQGGAIGTQQKDGFHQIAAGLFDGACCEFRVVHRALGHDAVDRQLELLANLFDAEFGLCSVATALLGKQFVAIEDGGFTAFDGHVHVRSPECSRCAWYAAGRPHAWAW